MALARVITAIWAVLYVASALAGGGPLGIDRRIGIDNDGIWSRHTQHILYNTLVTADVLAGLWEGDATRFGRTSWQSIDGLVISTASTELLKRTFRRRRPANTDAPNDWFATSRDRSFPSGEAASFAAMVTPFVLEYGPERPWVYALAVLPVYDGYARMKTRGHWQTDVLAGLAVGTMAGWYAHGRSQSFTVQLLPHGLRVGLSGRF